MNTLHRRRSGWRITMLVVVAITGPMLGCSDGQDVTPQALEQAKQLWKKAGIRDYELEWKVSSSNNAHYLVTVRDGEVSKIDSIQPDGHVVAGKSNAPRFFSVDGLFLTIAEELAQLKTERPFTRPQGTKVLMRFKPDPKLGYPRWYRRDVMGSMQSMRIDVIRLVPKQVAPQASK